MLNKKILFSLLPLLLLLGFGGNVFALNSIESTDKYTSSFSVVRSGHDFNGNTYSSKNCFDDTHLSNCLGGKNGFLKISFNKDVYISNLQFVENNFIVNSLDYVKVNNTNYSLDELPTFFDNANSIIFYPVSGKFLHFGYVYFDFSEL